MHLTIHIPSDKPHHPHKKLAYTPCQNNKFRQLRCESYISQKSSLNPSTRGKLLYELFRIRLNHIPVRKVLKTNLFLAKCSI